MKKLINNKLYDTATAKELCAKRGGDSNFGKIQVLFKTQMGAFFYHHYSTNKKTGGKSDVDIEVCTPAQAQEFYALNGGDIDNWKEVFGEEVEKA